MPTKIRLHTHEAIIHSQMALIETGLKRPVEFQVILNQKEVRSTIEFEVSDKELSTLKYEMGCNIFIFDGERWLPHL
jgi:hypothetical protein